MHFGMRNFTGHFLGMRFFAGVFFCLVAGGVSGQTLQDDPNAVTMTVMPMALDVVAPKVSDTITVRNGSRRPMQVQFRIFRWQKRDGQDFYAPTTDVVVTPPFVKIRPGGDGTVRVVRVAKQPVRGEESYRVFVDQMPSSRVRTNVSGAQPGVSMILSQSLPVFFSSLGARAAVDSPPSPPAASKQANFSPVPAADSSQDAPQAPQTVATSLVFEVQNNGGHYNLIVTNTGGSRVRLADVELLAGKSRVARKKGLLGYALPGQSASFSLSGRGGGLPDRVRYTTEAGRLEMLLR